MSTQRRNLILALLLTVAGLATTPAFAQGDAVPPRLFQVGAPRTLVPDSSRPEGLVQLRSAAPGISPAPGANDDAGTPKSKTEPEQLLNAATPGTLGVNSVVGEPNGTDQPIDTSHLFADPLQYNPAIPKAEAPVYWKAFEFGPEIVEFPHKPLSKLFALLVRGKAVDPHTELNQHPIGLQAIPERPPLIIETDEPFLSNGWLQEGIEIPTGAIWRPALWVFGTYRNGINYTASGVK